VLLSLRLDFRAMGRNLTDQAFEGISGISAKVRSLRESYWTRILGWAELPSLGSTKSMSRQNAAPVGAEEVRQLEAGLGAEGA